jgi:hypothetical protein
MKKLFALVCVLLVTSMVSAGIIFQDTFENKTAGTNLAHYDVPTTGAHYWLNLGNTAGAATYQNDGGNMVLKADRTGGKYVFSQTYTGGPEATVVAGAEFKFSYDWKSDGTLWSGPSVNFNFGGTASGGAFSYAGGYSYYVNGAWYGTAPAGNVWYNVAYVVRAGAASGGYVPINYDVYVNNTKIASNIAGSSAAVGSNPRLDMYVVGANGVVLYDNITIESVPEPATIAIISVGALSLLRRKKTS